MAKMKAKNRSKKTTKPADSKHRSLMKDGLALIRQEKLGRFPHSMPRGAIVESKEHHESVFYYCRNMKEVHKAALHVLTRQSQYIDFNENPEAKNPGLTTESIAVLPTENLKQAAAEELRLYNERVLWYQRQSKQRAAIKQAIETKDGALAYHCLSRFYLNLDPFVLIEPMDYND